MKNLLKKIGKPFEKLGKTIIEVAPNLGKAVLAENGKWVGVALDALGIEDIS